SEQDQHSDDYRQGLFHKALVSDFSTGFEWARWAVEGAAVLARTMISAGKRLGSGRSPRIRLSMEFMAATPRRNLGWRMVVSGTQKYSLSRTLPKPTMESSSGILIPCLRNVLAAPMATRS